MKKIISVLTILGVLLVNAIPTFTVEYHSTGMGSANGNFVY